MPGWLFRVTTKRLDGVPSGVPSGDPVVEVYIASIADRMAAWAAVAAEVNRIDPLGTAEVTGEASDMRLEAEAVPVGGVKRLARTS